MNTFARMYQLLGGGLLAVYVFEAESHAANSLTNDSPASASLARLLSEGSLCLLVGLLCSGFLLPELPSFLGGCLATLFTCLLILGMEWELLGVKDKSLGTGVTSRVLQMPWLVYLGELSFSIYLWHFPILVIGDSLGWLPESPILHALSLLVTSTALGFLSRKILEIPFSRLSLSGERRQLAVACSALVLAVTLAGLLSLILTPSIPEIAGMRETFDPSQVCFHTGLPTDMTLGNVQREMQRLEHTRRQVEAQLRTLSQEKKRLAGKERPTGDGKEIEVGDSRERESEAEGDRQESYRHSSDLEAIEFYDERREEEERDTEEGGAEESALKVVGEQVLGRGEVPSDVTIAFVDDAEEIVAELETYMEMELYTGASGEEEEKGCGWEDSRPIRVLVIGDSHCEKAEAMMRVLAQEYGFEVEMYCLPRDGTVALHQVPRLNVDRCPWLKGFEEKIKGVDLVIVFNFVIQMTCRINHPDCTWKGNPQATEEETQQLVEDVESFFSELILPFGVEDVLVMEPPPFPLYHVKDCLVMKGTKACDFDVKHYINYPSAITAYEALADAHDQVTLVPNDDFLCPDGRCKVLSDDGVLLFIDGYHVGSDYWAANADRVADLWMDHGIDLSRRICLPDDQ